MLKRETAVLIVMVGLAGLAVISPKLYEQFTVRESSVSVRFLQYEAAVKMIIDHPFLGVGLNNSTGQKSKYVNITYNQYDPDTQFDREPTHNLYLGMASEIGVFGTLLFVTFFARAALSAWRHSRRATDPEVRWLANALLVAFCGAAVDGLIDPIPEYQVLILLWLYAGISFNLPRMAPTTNTVRPVLHHRISLPAPARSSDANSVTR
jgi:O-antigen ligase